MSEQKNLSEQQIAELKHQIREEVKAELLQKLDSKQKFLFLRKNLDIAFIWGGFLSFVTFLVAGKHSLADISSVFISTVENPVLFIGNIPILVLIVSPSSVAVRYSIAMGMLFIGISPAFILLKNPKLLIIFSSTVWLYGVNHVALWLMMTPQEAEGESFTYYTLLISYILVAIGYLLRYIKLGKPNPRHLAIFILSFISITFLLIIGFLARALNP